jgi:hypothetical protein
VRYALVCEPIYPKSTAFKATKQARMEMFGVFGKQLDS